MECSCCGNPMRHEPRDIDIQYCGHQRTLCDVVAHYCDECGERDFEGDEESIYTRLVNAFRLYIDTQAKKRRAIYPLCWR